MKKICKKCGEEKDVSEFQFRKDSGKYRNECKICVSIYKKNNRIKNSELLKEKRKDYYEKNKDEIKKRKKKHYENNKSKISKKHKEYYKNNREKLNEYQKEYQSKNSDALREKRKERYLKNKEEILSSQKLYYEKNKSKILNRNKAWRKNNKSKRSEKEKILKSKDPIYKFICYNRSRISTTLKKCGSKKSNHTLKLIGCTRDFLKQYIEDQFVMGMTWEKYLNGEIHIDHKIPLRFFDLTKPEEQKKAFHYSNLQPLWKEWNLWKNDKYIETQDGKIEPITIKHFMEIYE